MQTWKWQTKLKAATTTKNPKVQKQQQMTNELKQILNETVQIKATSSSQTTTNLKCILWYLVWLHIQCQRSVDNYYCNCEWINWNGRMNRNKTKRNELKWTVREWRERKKNKQSENCRWASFVRLTHFRVVSTAQFFAFPLSLSLFPPHICFCCRICMTTSSMPIPMTHALTTYTKRKNRTSAITYYTRIRRKAFRVGCLMYDVSCALGCY